MPCSAIITEASPCHRWEQMQRGPQPDTVQRENESLGNTYQTPPLGAQEHCERGNKNYNSQRGRKAPRKTPTSRGLERWLRGQEHWLPFWRSLVQFPESTWQFTNVYNCGARWSDTLIQTYMQNKNKKQKKKKKSNKPQIINKNTNQASKQKTTKTKTKQNKLTKESKKKKKKKNAPLNQYDQCT